MQAYSTGRFDMGRFLLIGAVAAVFFYPHAAKGQDLAKKVLETKEPAKKAVAIIRARKSVLGTTDVMALVTREQHDETAALALGMYLEGGQFDSPGMAACVAAHSKRKSDGGKAATMAAICKHRDGIVGDLTKKRSAEGVRLAAQILATAAFIDSESVKAESLAPLLEHRDARTLEWAILAAAFARAKGAAEAIDAIDARAPEVTAARQFYRARIGQPLDEKAINQTLGARIRIDRRFTKVTPLMSNYDISADALRYTIMALGEAKSLEHIAKLGELLTHADQRVQIEAARALGLMDSEQSLDALHAQLKGKAGWPTRVAVWDAIGRIGSPSSVQPLIASLAAEDGRFRQDANYALASIAGKQMAKTSGGWTRWRKQAGDLKRDPKRTAAFREKHSVGDMHVDALASFYSASVISTRFAFVIDTSKSMKGEKIDQLLDNLRMTLDELPKIVRFNLVNFGGEVTVLAPGKLIAAGFSKQVQHQLEYFELTLGTRTYDAMEAGMLLPEADTIMYLSDGAPVGGQWGKWSTIGKAMRVFNRDRRVAIQTILYGGGGKAKSMSAIAKENAGNNTRADAAPGLVELEFD